MTAVLDASALLALINGEKGAERVAEVLGDAQISAVNLSEVAGKLIDKGIGGRSVDHHLAGLGVAVIDFDRSGALDTAVLRRSLPLSLSLGDRACLTLGIRTGAPVFTADRQWAKLGVRGLTVVTIR